MTEQNKNTIPPLALSLIPPSPVTDKIEVEIRGTVRNSEADTQTVQASLYLNEITPDALIWQDTLEVAGNAVTGFSTRLATAGKAGHHRVILDVSGNEESQRCERDLEIIASTTRSPRTIGGAWVGLFHFQEVEGRYWNEMLSTFTEADWRELVRGMHQSGMNLIVIQETWRNQTWYGEHYHQMNLENYKDTYAGKAFYPSNLWPEKMDLPCEDPIEAILSEADTLGMQVMLGLGLYAHFDYTAGSLAWHKDIMTELWERYGAHPSLYGWYISEEGNGWIKPHEMRYWDRTEEFREEVLTFFRELAAHRDTIAPNMPLMQAPDSCHHGEAIETWTELARYCDIFCIQTYRYPRQDDVPLDENIARMQALCDAAGSHLWLDLEAFVFEEAAASDVDDAETDPDEMQWMPLIPDSMENLAADLERLHHFEFVCTYQYPGIFCAPEATKQLGGTAAVQLYRDYLAYIKSL